MKKVVSIVVAVLFSFVAIADDYQKYVEKYADIAVKEMKRTGVPASITLAQGLLESRAGLSPLAADGNNHFGIKCHNDWDGKKMYHDDDANNECFRVYKSAEESFKNHSDFLRGRDRYKSLFELPQDDYKAWAHGLKEAGYATDPRYAHKLIKLIEDYELYEYDKDVKVTLKTPRQEETPVLIPQQERSSNYKETIALSLRRELYSQNGVPCIYALEGESYSSIAASQGLFLRELLRYNDLKEDMPLEKGTIVYLARKKQEGPVGQYVVDTEGETLYRIAQRFGIRYATLQQLNVLLLGKTLEPGDTVRLRK
ncbi:MAG: glucosaminidase domain-containing protein [Bacteroidales bacterium]|nr:glucosaminidase domain-containing protein [Bacteroidales bacterium]